MKPDDNYDRLVDMLLSESIGKNEPPDVRGRVLEMVDELPRVATPRRQPVRWATMGQPTRRSKAPAFALAAILTMLCVAGALIHFQQISKARTPVLSEVSGRADRGLGIIPLGESLNIGSGARAVLSYQDGSRVELGPETSIVVTKGSLWDRSKELKLVAGSIAAEVRPQKPGSPFLLGTEDARAEVLGTELSFDLNADRTRLEVSHGAVRFVSRKWGREVVVKDGYFAESGKAGFRHEKVPVPGITRFTLMNAETDEPIREQALGNGETIFLSSLPTRQINIRADFEGDPPDSVKISLKRQRGNPTGLEGLPSDDHKHPPYFVGGDHWADGRPDDCAAWTPPAGLYHLSAEAIYADAEKQALSRPLEIRFRVRN
jgi:hypothetical protein